MQVNEDGCWTDQLPMWGSILPNEFFQMDEIDLILLACNGNTANGCVVWAGRASSFS